MKQILLFATLISSVFSFSQITYNSSNYASGNYSQQMTTVRIGSIGQDFDTTGANITWDYSSIGIEETGTDKTITPSASGYQATFITQCILAGGGFTCLTKWNNLTNIGVVDLDSMDAFVATLYDVMTMAKKSSSKLIGNIKGLRIKDTNGLTIPLITEYLSPDTIIEFPFTYQDSGKSYGAWGMDLNSLGQNIVYKVTYDRSWEVEGWGTLITPFRTHTNTVKVKTVLDQVDSVNFLGANFGLPRKIVEYTWYDANFGLPVMKAEGLDVLGFVTINSVKYYDLRFAGINEQEPTKSFSVFPNPASNIISISLENETDISSYRIIDIQGKLISRKKYTQQISVKNLKSGVYFIQLLSDNMIVGTEKFVKE